MKFCKFFIGGDRLYKDLFNKDKQASMRSYFYDLASLYGVMKNYKKDDIINYTAGSNIIIVISGVINQFIVSSKGQKKSLYLLRKGEISGETFFFCGGHNPIISQAKEDCIISIISIPIIEEELLKTPEVYRYFIHSITRKYRIVMLQLTTCIFNDSLGKVADTLLRLSACNTRDYENKSFVNMVLTHEELSNNIGCSRITVTKCLNYFCDEEIISYENKKIIIKNEAALKSYVNTIL